MTTMTDTREVAFADKSILDSYVAKGLLTRRQNGDLFIYNYTPKCVFDKAWDSVTLTCRGFIIAEDGEVIARPFAKFFNLEEWDGKALPEGPVEVYEKVDGSLFIAAHHRTHGLVTATRGSFFSDQAREGTEMLNELNWGGVFREGLTYLFEVIYPENKIVVDYGSARKLVLIGAVDNVTGRSLSHSSIMHVADAIGVEFAQQMHTFSSADQAFRLKQLVAPNSEGFVLRFSDEVRIKVKGEEYLRLHKIVTNTNNKTVWEMMKDGRTFEALIKDVPDEFMKWVLDEADKLRSAFDRIETANEKAFVEINQLPRPRFATEVANVAQHNDDLNSGVLFKMKDGKPYDDLIWKMLKPETVRWPSTPHA